MLLRSCRLGHHAFKREYKQAASPSTGRKKTRVCAARRCSPCCLRAGSIVCSPVIPCAAPSLALWALLSELNRLAEWRLVRSRWSRWALMVSVLTSALLMHRVPTLNTLVMSGLYLCWLDRLRAFVRTN